MEIKVGDRFTTNKGGDVVVVEYVQADKIIVEFTDSNKHRVVTTKTVLLKGDIKNPFAPLLFGVGYMGVGKHKTKDGPARLGFMSTQNYSTWVNMLSRCYNLGYAQSEGYAHIVVDEDWHNFQNFADWYTDQLRNNKFDGKLCLDKDILSDEFIYSASTCCVIPHAINMLIKSSRGGKHMQGVGSTKQGFHVILRPLVPDIVYETEKEAHLAYIEAKSNKIREVATEYKEYLAPEVFDALMTRDFRYKFSPLFEPEKKATLH